MNTRIFGEFVWRFVVTLLAMGCSPAFSANIDCALVAPPGITKTAEGATAASAAAGSIFKAVNVGGNVNAEGKAHFATAQQSAPSEDPQALKSRILYIFCGLVVPAKDITTERKVEMLNQLAQSLGLPSVYPPPAQPSSASQPQPPNPPPTLPVDADFKVLPQDSAPSCDLAPGPSPLPVRVPTEADGLYNLAVLVGARASSSSVIPGYPGKHQTEFLNDGWYNNCRSWIPESLPAWVEIDLGKDYEISSVAFGSEYQQFYNDRHPSAFTISTARSSHHSTWDELYSATNHPVSGRQEFHTTPRLARYVRISITQSVGGADSRPRIDEIEVWGKWHP